jgi:Ca-activated chloride channel family protein
MSFAEPAFLLAMLLVPLAVLAQVASRRRATRHAVRFTGVTTLKLAAATVPAWRRHVPAALALAALAALVLALAKPQRTVAVP